MAYLGQRDALLPRPLADLVPADKTARYPTNFAAMPAEFIRSSLRYRPPLSWSAFSRFLAGRSAASVESIHEGRYWRTVRLHGVTGWIGVAPATTAGTLRVRFSPSLAPQAVIALREKIVAGQRQSAPVRESSLRSWRPTSTSEAWLRKR